ncbi:hypothetical protein GF374_02650 [Candidatus Woesearchaeota archaeon]|nr:hypothetical protein [Candidatus Woesearchaeota archaeon]
MATEDHEQIHKLIFKEDDITWRSLIHELVREGKIDPWDVDVSVLANEYLQIIGKLKELNFRLSGKVILAAAILLKLKSKRLGMEQIMSVVNPEETDDAMQDELLMQQQKQEKHFTKAKLKPRVPGVRKRKVTADELVGALKKALEVEERRKKRLADIAAAKPPPPKKPKKKVDIFNKIEEVWARLKDYIAKRKAKAIEFTHIVPTKKKKDIIWTFVPLLHLANDNKIELKQEDAFGKIQVLVKEKELHKTLNKDIAK